LEAVDPAAAAAAATMTGSDPPLVVSTSEDDGEAPGRMIFFGFLGRNFPACEGGGGMVGAGCYCFSFCSKEMSGLLIVFF
jgi:hypothetical protein